MEYIHNTHSFPSHTGNTDIFVQTVEPADKNIKGIIQIVHGMAEHTDRYIEAAEFFADNGFAVIMHDHAGHGRSVKDDSMLGFFCEKGGYKRLVEDVKSVSELAKKLWEGKKIVLWGHSMGSFISRNYIAAFAGNVDGAVICGTSGKNPGAPAGMLIADIISKVKGPFYKSKFIDNLAFGSYNKKFDGFEWLSVNKDLFSVLNSVSGDKWYSDVPKSMRIRLIAGTDDPVGNYGKGVREVYEKLVATGHENVSIRLFDGLRHEIHNEDERFDVYRDIIDFAESAAD